MANPTMRLGLRAFRQPQLLRQPVRSTQRRNVQTAAGTIEAPVVQESALTKFYNSPIGPKTVHFWAPIMKWGVVLAGASDFLRPASQLSITQNMALMATGAIWTRWCFVIKPRNLFLASVNFLLFSVGAAQTARVLSYQRSLKGETMGEEIKDELKREAGLVEKVVKHPESVIEAVKGK
ncbi:hypothetical protein LTR91_023255 [Friedmanniomyces endolithicus]|uniref:Mitochondrial pyruvate carrier n=1 Tax=Friedmanniomyces endolithicus TaxID=329885 RepID=A0AAN6JY11_9PEZI|nr:hypothetical protein LTS09_016406 [Friedmanniomyces endolithicus]KAK0362916.1 hypothetical protein LTR94_017554 [Friedmanniomyces endolithicus]KAK0772413.1 hypothetical protein LTR59_015673 [Friedmanniomyces endolithicus]KAK0782354.1 hypothetical protein LTR38_013416 [Friedmanniomyces endolithicus]KAK0813501.1 hypothetical protein LTR75_004595 [Friedmanniomyces endolithicus]